MVQYSLTETYVMRYLRKVEEQTSMDRIRTGILSQEPHLH